MRALESCFRGLDCNRAVGEGNDRELKDVNAKDGLIFQKLQHNQGPLH